MFNLITKKIKCQIIDKKLNNISNAGKLIKKLGHRITELGNFEPTRPGPFYFYD